MTVMAEGTEKKCTKCGITKPLGEFHNLRSSRDGRARRCKPCQKTASKVARALDASSLPTGTLRPRCPQRTKWCDDCREYYNGKAPNCPYCRKEKPCGECRQWKPLDQYYVHSASMDGHDSECIECVREHVHIWRTYGMTREDYDALIAKQDGKCAICKGSPPWGRQKRLHVDHNHRTLMNRGLLCIQCNHGIGNFMDNPELLEAAIAYLKEYA